MSNNNYVYAGLNIELTRKCNLQCAHCMRGPAQNVTMSTEIIDKLADDVSDCAQISLYGGETLTEIDRFEYLVDKVSQWPNLIHIGLVTNGTILNSKLIEIAEKFCTQDTRRFFSIGISKDEFHPDGASDNAYSFYEPLVDAANKRLGNATIILNLHEVAEENLAYHGRAKQIIDESSIDDFEKRKLKVLTNKAHRLKITGNVVHCAVEITAHGDVEINCDECSYDEIDGSSIGNILDTSLDEIIDRHQSTCLMLCSEVDFFDASKQWSVSSGLIEHEFEIDMQIKILELLSERVIDVRKRIRERYPLLSASDIISGIQMPGNEQAFRFMIATLHAASPYQGINTDVLIKNLGEEIFLDLFTGKNTSKEAMQYRTIFLIAYAYLLDSKVIDFLIDTIYKDEIKILELRTALYELGGTPDNSKVFPCETSAPFSNKYYDQTLYDALGLRQDDTDEDKKND